MEGRLPSQIYVVGNFLLLLVVGLALLMMPRAMALDPAVDGSLPIRQQFEQAAGLRALGATGLPELRIWSVREPAAASGAVITPAAIERIGISETRDGGARWRITGRSRETTPAAAEAIRRLREFAAFDSHFLVCGSGAGSLSVSGYVDGRIFSFHETGDCAGARAPALDTLLRLARIKP